VFYNEAQTAGRLLGLTSVETDQLPELAQGEGLWRVNEQDSVVRHILTPDELALLDTNARMFPVSMPNLAWRSQAERNRSRDRLLSFDGLLSATPSGAEAWS
jgi:hypothetical protein